MAESKKKTEAPAKRVPTLYFIVLHHVAKGTLLLLTALGIFALNRSGHPLGGVYDQLLHWLHLDPTQKFFANIGDELNQITPANMRVAEMGSILYGLIIFGAGLGLAFRAHWAVWLAIGESAFGIPIELYELSRHLSPRPSLVPPHPDMFHHPVLGLLAVLAVNVIVVIYLSVNRHKIFKHH
jgi:uncharacterized membrane protein (DUF2068 family)